MRNINWYHKSKLKTLTQLRAMTAAEMETELNLYPSEYYSSFQSQWVLDNAEWSWHAYDYVVHNPNTWDMFYLYKCGLACGREATPYGPDISF